MLSPLLLTWPLAIALAGLAAAVSPEHGTTMHLIGRPWLGALQMAATVAFLVLAACARSPRQATAWTAVALSWPLPELAGWTGLSLDGRTLADAWSRAIPVLLLLALLPPSTRPDQRRAGRRAVAIAAAAGGIAVGARTLLVDPFLDVSCWRTCDHNPLLVAHVGQAAQAVDRTAGLLLAAAAVVFLWTVVPASLRKSWTSRTSAVAASLLVLAAAAAPLLSWARPGADSAPALVAFAAAQLAAVALATVTASDRVQDRLLRARLTRLAGDVQAAPAPGALVEALRAAVRDPSLEVHYWTPTRSAWVDAEGHPRAPAELAGPGRRTRIMRAGSPVATIHHGPGVRGDRVERALGPALRLALANEQLRAAALAELTELQTSQVRILERSALERRRLERNLHDGAQQRAVSLALLVRMLAGHLAGAGLHDLAERAQVLTRLTVEELRRVARGIYPAALSDAGLAGAVQDLAEASTAVAVEVVDLPTARLPGHVETTAYLFVATSLGSAERRGASVARVTASCDDRLLCVRVDDDGRREPPGLEALDDQVRALDGEIQISPSVHGLAVVLEVSCRS